MNPGVDIDIDDEPRLNRVERPDGSKASCHERFGSARGIDQKMVEP